MQHYAQVTKPLSTSFDDCSEMTLSMFQHHLTTALTQNGILHLFNFWSADGTVVTLLKHWPRFSLDGLYQQCLNVWSKAQWGAAHETYVMLWKSLSPHLQALLGPQAPLFTDNGPLLYFVLMTALNSASISAIQVKEAEVKGIKLKDIPGENIATYVGLVTPLLSFIEGRRAFDETLLPTLLDNLSDCSTESFKFYIFQFKSQLQYLPWAEMLRQCVFEYRKLVDANRWSATTTAFHASTDLHRHIHSGGRSGARQGKPWSDTWESH
jgi:hypothetical protein